jgi:hypothetical protein
MELEGRAEIWRIVRGPATAMGEWRRLERAVGGGEGRGRDKAKLSQADQGLWYPCHRSTARGSEAVDRCGCVSQRVGNPYSGGGGEVHPWVTDKGVTMREVVHRSQEGSCVPFGVTFTECKHAVPKTFHRKAPVSRSGCTEVVWIGGLGWLVGVGANGLVGKGDRRRACVATAEWR